VKIIPSVVKRNGCKKPLASTAATFSFLLGASLLGTSCIGGKTTTSSTANASGFIRYYWNTSSFPLTLRLSDAFSANDVTEISAGVDAWEEASDNNYNFYNVSSGVPLNEGISNYSSWRSSTVDVYYYDDANGNTWPTGLSNSALAVTVNYGVYQGGNAIRLTASSIGVNGVRYDFFNETINGDYNAGEYSMQYVLAHEIGHSIGAGHISTGINSLMEPYVSIAQEFADVANDSSYGESLDDGSKAYIMGIYGLTLDTNLSSIYSDIVSNASNLMAGLTPDHLVASNVEPGDVVQVAQELMPDGTCVHKLNGVEISKHKTDLKQLKIVREE
jgi:hypothetical protein